jgi:hypothetical protein
MKVAAMLLMCAAIALFLLPQEPAIDFASPEELQGRGGEVVCGVYVATVDCNAQPPTTGICGNYRCPSLAGPCNQPFVEENLPNSNYVTIRAPVANDPENVKKQWTTSTVHCIKRQNCGSCEAKMENSVQFFICVPTGAPEYKDEHTHHVNLAPNAVCEDA